MPQILIRNFPAKLHSRLKARAKANLRSMNQEATLLLEQAMEKPATTVASPTEKPWMKGFGSLRHLHEETLKINKIIEEEFGQIDYEGWKK